MSKLPKKYLFDPKEFPELYRKDKSQEGQLDYEWLEIAEFGKHFGYAGIEAILNNEIDIEVVRVLIDGARNIDARAQVDTSQSMFIATASAKAKKPSSAFKKGIKALIERTKVKL